MLQYKSILLILSCFAFLISCNSDRKVNKDSAKAYQDYEAFVTEVERDTILKEQDLGAGWTARTDSMRAAFEKHRSDIEVHMSNYDPERREEINTFEDRLEVAFESRQKMYDDVSYRSKFRHEMLGLVVDEGNFSPITPSNLANTYEHFVTTLQRDMENFTRGDWQLIESWWNALEARRKAINGKLSAADKESIANHQNTYKMLHEQAVINAKTAATPAANN